MRATKPSEAAFSDTASRSGCRTTRPRTSLSTIVSTGSSNHSYDSYEREVFFVCGHTEQPPLITCLGDSNARSCPLREPIHTGRLPRPIRCKD
jgi:hypothetical protein